MGCRLNSEQSVCNRNDSGSAYRMDDGNRQLNFEMLASKSGLQYDGRHHVSRKDALKIATYLHVEEKAYTKVST